MFQIGSNYICIIKLFYRKLWFQFRYTFLVHYCYFFRVPTKFIGKLRIMPGYWEILTHYSPGCLLSTQILEKTFQAANLKREHRFLRRAWLSCEMTLNLPQALLEIEHKFLTFCTMTLKFYQNLSCFSRRSSKPLFQVSWKVGVGPVSCTMTNEAASWAWVGYVA